MDATIVTISPSVPNIPMGKDLRSIFLAVLALTVAAPAYCDLQSYQQEFARAVTKFANLNRLSIARLHRDVHADCYIPLTIATTIGNDGSLKKVTVVASSSVPVVDRYYVYVIEQLAPFQPLANHLDPAPREITVTQEFVLDARLWNDGTPSERECEKLKPRETL